MTELGALPGSELIESGLSDLRAGGETVPALLVAIASRRLRDAGIDVPPHSIRDAELRLYRALVRQDPDGAYPRYNALLRRLASLLHALEREMGAEIRARAR